MRKSLEGRLLSDAFLYGMLLEHKVRSMHEFYNYIGSPTGPGECLLACAP